MPDTFVKIASVTVGSGGASSMAFSSIPSTYTDLVIKMTGRNTDTGQTYAYLRFNSDSGSNYSAKTLVGSGSAASSGSLSAASSIYFIYVNPSDYTANTFSSDDIYIPNYAGSSYKSVSIDSANENNATGAFMSMIGGLWNNTSAINAITLTTIGTFAQYSTATLYGIKNS